MNDELDSFLLEWHSDSPFIRQRTSGSTGAPKVIELPKTKMISSARMTLHFFGLHPDSTFLICLNPDYIAGKMMLVRSLTNHAKTLLTPPESPLDFPDEFQIDFAAMVPLQVEKCLKNSPEKLKKIRTIIIGGAPVSTALEKEIAAAGITAYATFGMTETTSHIAVRKLGDPNTSYEAIGQTRFSAGTDEQLIISSPELEIDYLETNDVVELINSTHFIWKGRKDFVINSGGIKLFPEEIEKKIETAGLTKRFFISGIPDEKLGEKAILIIESESPIDTTPYLVQLTKYEKPKALLFTPHFRMTDSGKINRPATLKLFTF